MKIFKFITIQKNYEFQIKTSLKDDYELTINPSTKYFRTENIWVKAESIFAVSKRCRRQSKANIHLDTKDYGHLSIETGEKEFLKAIEENLLPRIWC